MIAPKCRYSTGDRAQSAGQRSKKEKHLDLSANMPVYLQHTARAHRSKNKQAPRFRSLQKLLQNTGKSRENASKEKKRRNNKNREKGTTLPLMHTYFTISQTSTLNSLLPFSSLLEQSKQGNAPRRLPHTPHPFSHAGNNSKHTPLLACVLEFQ